MARDTDRNKDQPMSIIREFSFLTMKLQHIHWKRSLHGQRTRILVLTGCLTRMGTTDITASQEGNFLYNAAAIVVQTLTVGEPSTLRYETSSDFQMFPNPTGEKIIIRGLTALPEKMIIVDGSGQIRLEKKLDSEMSVIDISFLPAGLYLIKVKDHASRFVID